MDRIKLICEAATKLFINQGYSLTQINHIADAVGISVGTIYHDFSGKKEIKNLILKSSIDREFLNSHFETPIKDKLFINLENEILETFNSSYKNFSCHIDDRAENYEFEFLIADCFDIFSRYAVGCLFIEKNQSDCGAIYDYYKDYRSRFYKTMREYLKIYIEKGHVRSLKYLDLTATMILEIISWWAMDARYSTFDPIDIPLEIAREICIDNIVKAYGK